MFVQKPSEECLTIKESNFTTVLRIPYIVSNSQVGRFMLTEHTIRDRQYLARGGIVVGGLHPVIPVHPAAILFFLKSKLAKCTNLLKHRTVRNIFENCNCYVNTFKISQIDGIR